MKITGLDWDDENDAHISRHGVSPDEVGNICYGLHFSRRDPAAKSNGKERYILSGKTDNGRYLHVVVEWLRGTYFRPITAVDMSESHRRAYERRLRGRRP